MILDSGLESASNTDIFSSGRLMTVPSNGVLSFEIQAADSVAANNYVVSIQLPDGQTPLNGVIVPAGEVAGLAGVIDDRVALKLRFRIGQGGHCVFSCVETGDTEMSWRAEFKPFRRR